MQTPDDELDDLRIHCTRERRACNMPAVIAITQRIDNLIRNQTRETR